jgi:hypothetical protein
MPDAFTDSSLIGPQRRLAARAQGTEADRQERSLELVLDDAVLDALADRLADRLVARLSAPERQEALVDAREVARRTGMTRRWVYDHARELGAVPLGAGQRPRLGFCPDVIEQLKAGAQPSTGALPLRAAPRRGRSTTGHSRTAQELLKGPPVVVGARARSGKEG